MSSDKDTEPTQSYRKGAATITTKDKHTRKAEQEKQAAPIAKPGGYKNDPPDATNPNEARERTLEKIRDRGPGR
jgi:hypothetical protein